MINIRYSNERGSSNHGWLQSRHSFSFSEYYDAGYMGVSSLRVINDDQVIAGKGFGSHSHQDMEIISYVKKGIIEHQDSMGNIKKLPVGEFQLMSAGTGVTHSEYNPSESDKLEFLQIWIQPNVLGVDPGYQQKHFGKHAGLQLVISPDGREESLKINQDAYLYQLFLDSKQTDNYSVESGRTVYVHVVTGGLLLNGEQLTAGDGATVTDVDIIEFVASDTTEALVFDLP